MIKQLQEIGLSEKEARVYLALLELGQAGVPEISQKSGVNRTTTYVILESLLKDGLVSQIEKEKKSYFMAENPQLLGRLIRRKESELKEKEKEFLEHLPQLTVLFETAGERPKVRFYEGKEGLKVIQDEILQTKDKRIEAIFSQDDLEKAFTQEEKKEYFNRRMKKKMGAKAIYTRGAGPFEKVAPIDELRIIPKDKFPLSVDITLFGDKMAISSLRGKLIGVIIENKDIVRTFRSIFELAWEAAERFQK